MPAGIRRCRSEERWAQWENEAILAIKEWHFREPVFVGDTIHVRSEVLAKEVRGRGRRGAITWKRQVLNQEHKVVQEGVTETLVEGRGSARPEAAAEPAENPA